MGYSQDKDQPIRWDRVLEWFEQTVGKGLSLAQTAKGLVYSEDQSGTTLHDMRDALLWINRAAEAGYLPAQLTLGDLHIEGEKVPRDYQIAMQWLQRAADQGDAQAQYKLARMYYMGLGMEPAPVQAAQWFHRSAHAGYIPAQAMLGHLYHRGVGVSVNIVEAERLYRAAAARGDAVAHGGLGILMFERGLSRRERIPYIYQWLKLGSEGGHRDAQVYLDELVLRMTPAQVAEGDQLVEHYRNAWREQSAAADAQARRCTGCGTTHNVQSVQGVQ